MMMGLNRCEEELIRRLIQCVISPMNRERKGTRRESLVVVANATREMIKKTQFIIVLEQQVSLLSQKSIFFNR